MKKSIATHTGNTSASAAENHSKKGVSRSQVSVLQTMPVVQMLAIKGTIVVKADGVYLLTAAGTEKKIPDAVVAEHNLTTMNGRSVNAEMSDATFQITGITSMAYVAPAVAAAAAAGPAAAPAAPMTALIDDETITHAWERHTLIGIHHLKRIASDYGGDSVALFPKNTTRDQVAAILNPLNGQALAWESRGGGQYAATHNGLRLIGSALGNQVRIDTAFPFDITMKKAIIEQKLLEYPHSWQAFVMFVPTPTAPIKKRAPVKR